MEAQKREYVTVPCVEKIYVNHIIDSEPDLSWLEDCRTVRYSDVPEGEEKERYIREDLQRLNNYGQTWVSIGIVAHAEVSIKYNGLRFYHKFQSSIWGIESDATDYIKDLQHEQIQAIKLEAEEKGVPISQYLEVIIDEEFKN